jgi:protein-disulfide isomerase
MKDRAIVPMALAVMATVALVRLGAQTAAPARGPENAALHIEAFLDFEAESSARLSVVLEALSDQEPNRVRLTFRHLPAASGNDVPPAHLAAAAAEAQGRFWEMASVLFANRDRHKPADLSGMAAQIGLDTRRFAADLEAPATRAAIEADLERAKELGVTTAPTIVANGSVLSTRLNLEDLRALIPQ